LFLGHHTTQIKSSSRLSLPSNWSKQLQGGLYLTQGFDQNLLVLTEDKFQALYERISSLNLADPLARLFLRMFLGSASYTELDENESVQLTAELTNYAGIKNKVVLVGQGEYLEVWAPGQWSKQEAQIQDAQANAERFSAFHIASR